MRRNSTPSDWPSMAVSQPRSDAEAKLLGVINALRASIPTWEERRIWNDFIAYCVPAYLAPAFSEYLVPTSAVSDLREFLLSSDSQTAVENLHHNDLGAEVRDRDRDGIIRADALRQRIVLGSICGVFIDLCAYADSRRASVEGGLANKASWQLPLDDVNELAEKARQRFVDSVIIHGGDEYLCRVSMATFRDFVDRLTLGAVAESAKEMEALFPAYTRKGAPGTLCVCLASPRFRSGGEVFIGLNSLLRRRYDHDLMSVFPLASTLLRELASELKTSPPDVRIRFQAFTVRQTWNGDGRQDEVDPLDIQEIFGNSNGGAVMASTLRAALRVPLTRRQIYSFALPAIDSEHSRALDQPCGDIDGIEAKLMGILREYNDYVGGWHSKERRPQLVVAKTQSDRRLLNFCAEQRMRLLTVATPRDLLRAELRHQFFLPRDPAPVPQYYVERPSHLADLVALLDHHGTTGPEGSSSQQAKPPFVLIRGERNAGKTRLWSRCCDEIYRGRLAESYQGGITLDFQNDADVADLFVAQFNEMLESDDQAGLFDDETGAASDRVSRVNRILDLLHASRSRYLLVLENLEEALEPGRHTVAHADLQAILTAINEHSSQAIQVVALSTIRPDLHGTWSGTTACIDLGRGDLNEPEAIGLLRILAGDAELVSAASDSDLSELFRHARTTVPFDILQVAEDLRSAGHGAKLSDYKWNDRPAALDRRWHALSELEQVALRLLNAVSPKLLTLTEIDGAIAQLVKGDDAPAPFDPAPLVKYGFLITAPSAAWRGADDGAGWSVGLSAQATSFVRAREDVSFQREREGKVGLPCLTSKDIWAWTARYFSQILEEYNDKRREDLSVTAFLKFEDNEFIVAANRWLDAIGHIDDVEAARTQWITYVLRSHVWWNEFCLFEPTQKLLEIWTHTPYYQSVSKDHVYELVRRFLEDYPYGSDWKGRHTMTARWDSVITSLEQLLRHFGLDWPPPRAERTTPERALLRAMIYDYLAEAMWYAGRDSESAPTSEDLYLHAADGYWRDATMAWNSPFVHAELAEYHLAKRHTALSLRQCKVAMDRGRKENRFDRYPVLPEEVETLALVYRVTSDALWQYYQDVKIEDYRTACIAGIELAAWYGYAFQCKPHPADLYTITMAEEIYGRCIARLKEALGTKPVAFRNACETLRQMWPDSGWPAELSPPGNRKLPVRLIDESDEDLRKLLLPPSPPATELGRQQYSYWVEHIATNSDVIRGLRSRIDVVDAALRSAIADSSGRPMFHQVTSRADSYAGHFLDILQQNFPPEETVALSSALRAMGNSTRTKAIVDPATPGDRLEVILDTEPNPSKRVPHGILWTEVNKTNQFAYVWYFAVTEKGQGRGTAAWQAMVQRFRNEGLKAIVWEVECPPAPGVAPADPHSQPVRRIAFYRKNGGKLTDADYMQHIGWLPPTKMCLMIQPLGKCSDAEQIGILRAAFGKDIKSIGSVDMET